MDPMLQYEIARAYYIENMGQQEIAARFGISRPKVSRILKEARLSGIVQISIKPPVEVTEDFLPQQLSRLLKIKSAEVVDTLSCPANNVSQRMKLLKMYAAGRLPELISDCRSVGVGWGNTIYQTVMEMDYTARDCGICFVPMVGNAGFSESAYQTNVIVERLAEKLRGSGVFLNTPAFVTEPELRKLLLSDEKMSEIYKKWAALDCSIFSLGGALEDSPVLMNEIGNNELTDKILREKPVGDVLGRYFKLQGGFISGVDELEISISREDFMAVPRRICLAAGENKAEAILAGARLGIFTQLITDTYTAMELIRRASLN